MLILACWLPFHLENLLLRLQIIQSEDVPKWLRCLTHLLVVIYPSLSPCLFAFRCKKLQRELRRTLRRRSRHPDLSFQDQFSVMFIVQTGYLFGHNLTHLLWLKTIISE